MVIYEYDCRCGRQFEQVFVSLAVAEPYLDSIACECGQVAQRVLTPIKAVRLSTPGRTN